MIQCILELPGWLANRSIGQPVQLLTNPAQNSVGQQCVCVCVETREEILWVETAEP